MKKDLAHQFFSIPSLISVASHGSALLIIAATDSLGVLPERWITQSLLVVAAMLAASLFGRRKSAYPFFLLVRFILILVLSAPTSASTSIKIVLMLPYLTDLLAYAPGSRVATCLATVSVMVAVFAQQGMIAWGVATSRPGLEQRLLQGLIGLGWIALTARMSRSQKRIQIQSFEIDRLNTVIDRLTDANISFQNYARSVADVTIQQERRRISKDIHDTRFRRSPLRAPWWHG